MQISAPARPQPQMPVGFFTKPMAICGLRSAAIPWPVARGRLRRKSRGKEAAVEKAEEKREWRRERGKEYLEQKGKHMVYKLCNRRISKTEINSTVNLKIENYPSHILQSNPPPQKKKPSKSGRSPKMEVFYLGLVCWIIPFVLYSINQIKEEQTYNSNNFQFTVGWARQGSIVWYTEAAGLTTPRFRLVAGEATMGWPTMAAGGLIAVQKSQQWEKVHIMTDMHLKSKKINFSIVDIPFRSGWLYRQVAPYLQLI